MVISMEKGRVCSCGSPKDVLQEFVANTECSDEGMADSDSTSAVDESEVRSVPAGAPVSTSCCGG